MVKLEPAVVAELEAIYERAMKLPPDALSILADRLAPNFPADPELQAELQRRWDAFLADPSRAIPGEVFLARLKSRMKSAVSV